MEPTQRFEENAEKWFLKENKCKDIIAKLLISNR